VSVDRKYSRHRECPSFLYLSMWEGGGEGIRCSILQIHGDTLFCVTASHLMPRRDMPSRSNVLCVHPYCAACHFVSSIVLVLALVLGMGSFPHTWDHPIVIPHNAGDDNVPPHLHPLPFLIPGISTPPSRHYPISGATFLRGNGSMEGTSL
jgi:hypothetical protein